MPPQMSKPQSCCKYSLTRNDKIFIYNLHLRFVTQGNNSRMTDLWQLIHDQ